MKYKLLDLFSGIAGFSLSLHPLTKTIGYCDNDSIVQNVLQERIQENKLDKAPIFSDIKNIDKDKLSQNEIDIVTAGFPCQDISVMNLKGKGLQGCRSNLGFDALYLSFAVNAKIIILENSPNIVNRGLASLTILLEKNDYDYIYDFFSARQVGAPHMRKRFYMVCVKKNDKRALKIIQDFSWEKKLWKHKDVISHAWDTPYKSDKVIPNNEKNKCDIKIRTHLLGNAIVPLCARFAIYFLSTYFLREYRYFLNKSQYNKSVPDKKYHFTIEIPFSQYKPNNQIKYPIILHKDILSTLLAANWNISKIGSSRACRILQNQIMYNVTTLTDKKNMDKNVYNWLINPLYLEWFMGYPYEWTKIKK